jgi:hypothetical protein
VPGAGTPGCNHRPLHATRRNERPEAIHVRPPPNMPVNTGRPATRSSEKTLEDIQGIVSERGLEPPRAKSSLGPQPSAQDLPPRNSRTFEDRQDVPGLLPAIPRLPLAPTEVPVRVPAEADGIVLSDRASMTASRPNHLPPVCVDDEPTAKQRAHRWRAGGRAPRRENNKRL